MAVFETTLVVPRPLAETFAFVSDLRNAPSWDPRAYEARKLTGGPIGVGTRFLLRGGIFTRQSFARLRVPDALRMIHELPYEVTAYEPDTRIVLSGETDTLRYEDRLELSAAGGVTRLRYRASLTLKGLLGLGDLALAPLFNRIGEEATHGIPAAVAASAPERGAGPSA